MGRIIPHIMENNKCSNPPTSIYDEKMWGISTFFTGTALPSWPGKNDGQVPFCYQTWFAVFAENEASMASSGITHPATFDHFGCLKLLLLVCFTIRTDGSPWLSWQICLETSSKCKERQGRSLNIACPVSQLQSPPKKNTWNAPRSKRAAFWTAKYCENLSKQSAKKMKCIFCIVTAHVWRKCMFCFSG